MRSVAIDMPVLVIGYGNVLRGDDGAGSAAAAALQSQLPRKTAEVLVCHQLLPELAERLSHFGLAVFIDADRRVPAGHFQMDTLRSDQESGHVVGHYQSPESLLAMARQLYGHAPRAVLFHVGADDFGFRRGLSKRVQHAIPKVAKAVIAAIQHAAQTPERHYA